MKKLKFVLFLILTVSSIAYSLDENADKIQTEISVTKFAGCNEIGFYVKDSLPIARMSQHAYNFCGGGISYSWCSPKMIGLSLRADAFFANANKNYVYSWYGMNVTGGLFMQFPVNECFAIQPEIEYGVQINNVKSSRDANGTYFDQLLMLSTAFRFGPTDNSKSALIFEAAPFYSMGFETDGISQAAGLRLGVVRRFGAKTTK